MKVLAIIGLVLCAVVYVVLPHIAMYYYEDDNERIVSYFLTLLHLVGTVAAMFVIGKYFVLW
jgi:hypothetical protein